MTGTLTRWEARLLNLPDMGTVEYREDFIGDQVPDALHVSVSGNGVVRPSSNLMVGGWLEMAGYGKESIARCRLGEDIDDSPVHHLNFAATKNARAEARIVVNTLEDCDITVGFVGHQDPDNVGGAWLYRSATRSWLFQVVKNKTASVIATGFTHVPGHPFCLGVATSPGAVVAYVNRCEVGAITSNIPTEHGMPFEFQLWNARKPNGAWSSPTVWVDYLIVQQDR